VTPGRVLDLRLGVPVGVAWAGLAVGMTRPGLLALVATVAVVVGAVALEAAVVTRPAGGVIGAVLLVVALGAGLCAGLTGQAAARDEIRHPPVLVSAWGTP